MIALGLVQSTYHFVVCSVVCSITNFHSLRGNKRRKGRSVSRFSFLLKSHSGIAFSYMLTRLKIFKVATVPLLLLFYNKLNTG